MVKDFCGIECNKCRQIQMKCHGQGCITLNRMMIEYISSVMTISTYTNCSNYYKILQHINKPFAHISI